MEEYRQYLTHYFSTYPEQYETILEKIQNHTYLYHMEEDLTSKYVNGRYQPAVILRAHTRTLYYWLFDGEIKDWDHPFEVVVSDEKGIINITYYSTERIINNKPILLIKYLNRLDEYYNRSLDNIILKNIASRELETTNSIYELAGIEPGQISPLF